MLVSGFSVWYWPRVKRWARALRVRRGRGRLAFHLDLHNAIGIATILPITLIVLTGINFVFREQVASALDLVVHQTRARDGARRISSVCEVVRVAGGAGTRELLLPDGGVRPRSQGRS